MQESKTISNLSEFMDWISYCYTQLKDTQQLNSRRPLFFRGQANAAWQLQPSVFRLPNNTERALVLDYKQVFIKECSYFNEIERILTEMQHHQIPTRFLDWSISPLTALFFACENIHAGKRDEDKLKDVPDSKIYAMSPWRAYSSIISESHDRPTYYFEILKEARLHLALEWTVTEIKKHILRKYEYEISEKEMCDPLPIVGKYMDDRIRSQQGCFTIWGLDQKSLNEFSSFSPSIISATIPKDAKPKLLHSLAQLGVDEFTLFPDREGMKNAIRKSGGIFRHSLYDFN